MMHQQKPDQPILYSFRRCPYAMRARMAIACSGNSVELREVVLRNKPESLFGYSPKGTVPVLVLPDGEVIEQSIDIMHWALSGNDPRHCLYGADETALREAADSLIHENDHQFKQYLDRYKYPDRYLENPMAHYREQGEVFLQRLEHHLQNHPYLLADRMTLADMSIAPFVRQFARVDEKWFEQTPYIHLQRWLKSIVDSPLFVSAMKQYKAWEPGAEKVYFP